MISENLKPAALKTMHEDSAGKFGLLSNQGISGSISLEA